MPKTEPTILCPTGIDLDRLDPDAVKATQRLVARGFEAYLVGGCVRDLLLRRQPKDFDIATSARPQQVKRTFPRNCRIIGRRFKLAHLHFQRNTKILELSTFRRTPEDGDEEDLLITRDNEFGTAEQDALRRDFTVNALFLDPTNDTIVDHTKGLLDIRAKVIRTIGDPRVRFREDPVRILRAAKFAGRLGFSIEPETYAAMAETAGDLVRAAPPRVLEEILRLLRGGHALSSFQLLRDVGAIKYLVPAVADFLGAADHDHRESFWRLLEALDRRVLAGEVPQNAVLLGALLVWPVLARAEREPNRSPSSVAEELLGSLSLDLKLPRRDAGCLKRICGVQHRFEPAGQGRRFRTAGFLRGPYFAEALELFGLRVDAGEAEQQQFELWSKLAGGSADEEPEVEADGDALDEAPEADEPEPRSRRRRRRRRGRRRHAEDADEGSAEAATDGEELPAAATDEDEAEATTAPAATAPRRRDARPEPARKKPAAEDPDAFGFGAVTEDDEPTDEAAAEDTADDRDEGEAEQPAADTGVIEPATDEDTEADEGEEGEGAEAPTRASRRKRRRRRKKKSGASESAEGQPVARAEAPRAEEADARRAGRKAKKAKAKKPQRKRRGQEKPHDVDVVPRFRDRRGKVEVLEPEALDLSAFDVELDPKRVPTFGTIVEGKARPKRRTPRVRDDGLDDYKPPPPPGSDAPPPPPRNDSDEPDTFGDW